MESGKKPKNFFPELRGKVTHAIDARGNVKEELLKATGLTVTERRFRRRK